MKVRKSNVKQISRFQALRSLFFQLKDKKKPSWHTLIIMWSWKSHADQTIWCDAALLSHTDTRLSISCGDNNMKIVYVYSLILKVKINYNYELFHNHFCYKLHYTVTFLAWCSAGLSIDLSEFMSIQWAVPSIRMTRSSSTEVSFQTTLNSVHGSMLPWSEITSHVQSLHSTLSLHAYEWTQTHIIT